tara:strand:+ start:211 stop:399 length:189 start_codon:yes stop_codon:yes gene_type:complete
MKGNKMTTEEAKLITELVKTFKQGVVGNHNFSKQIAQGVQGLADLVLILEKRVQVLEGKQND